MEATIEQLLKKARELSASDIHVAVGADCHYRINGELRAAGEEPLSPEDIKTLLLSAVPERFRKALAKKGEVSFIFSTPELGRCRIHVFKQRALYGIVIHLIPIEIPDWKGLGIPKSVIGLSKRKKGLVLVTGSSGMGKSSTLAALLNEINKSRCCHIVTLEEPIEYVHRHSQSIISQREVGTDTPSYASGLKAAMAEDADVIMAGEMKDAETLFHALSAAENGRLVFSSFHTIGAVATIERFVDSFPVERQQQMRLWLSNVLEAVISQQLIPTIDGAGRAAACEVMYMSPAIRNLIREGKDHQINAAIQTARKQGMQTMDDAIYELYSEGRISDLAALEFALDPVALERKLY